MDTKRLPSCIFRTRDDGIHEFTFLKSERAAIDQYITHLTNLFSGPKRQERVRILIDLRESGALPLPYLFQRSREFIANTPNLSTTQMAIVYGGGLMTSVTDAFFRALRLEILRVRWFSNENYHGAEQGLNSPLAASTPDSAQPNVS